MKKCFFVTLIVLFIIPLVFSETLFERSFAEMGHESFLVEGASQRNCQKITFIYPKERSLESAEIYPILSIGVEFGPTNEGKIDVNALVNGFLIKNMGFEDFKCKEETCWERVALPKQNLLEEENELEICLGTGNTITSILLSNQSGIGLYKEADFSKENSFRMVAEKTELVMGEKTEIKILLHNQGSDSSLAEIKFARPLAEDKNAFSVVEGNTYFTGVVEAGEEIEITYIVKPRRAVPMTLPPAIVYYENTFGEKESKFSGLVFLNVREPERKIEAFIVKKEENVLVGQTVEMQLAIKNIGLDSLYDLSIEMESEADIIQNTKEIESLSPKETLYLTFTASGLEAGKFPIGCTVKYIDTNISESHCQNSFVEFSEPGIDPTIIAGLILVVVAIAAYVYIMKS